MSIKIMKSCIVFVLVIIMGCSFQPEGQWNLSSPGGELEMKVFLDEDGRLFYSLWNGKTQVIEQSPLGLIFQETTFDSNLDFKSRKISKNQKDSYTLVVGKRKENHAEWNELNLVFENPQQKQIQLNFRMFDSGLAFNYQFDDELHSDYTLLEELTGFKIPEESKAWMHSARTTSNYETFYKNGIPVGTPSPEGKYSWAFPLLFNTGSHWTLITEAGVPDGYAGMYVDGNPAGNLYKLILPGEDEAFGLCPAQPTISLPTETAWRVIITGTHPGVIVESNLVFDVSKPNVLGDISWIKPGRAAWSWWSENDSPQDFNRLKEYVDFTRQMGWEYFLVDANWNHMRGGTLHELTSYANSVGVRVLNWYNSGGPHNDITEEPRDLMHTREARRDEFQRISEWGIYGIKVDFFLSDKACIMQQYHDILRDAADFGLVVNVHGSTLPRGWERTYPNLMTMESVKGAEFYLFDEDYPKFAPWHNTILPFTRNVVGSMDYTPVTFSDSRFPKRTTHAHELALAVLFESGIQHFADSDRSYLAQPEYVMDYLKDVPVTWDETHYVAGTPGEMVIIARRKGEKWYMSGINGTNEEMVMEIVPKFLAEGNYSIQIIGDGSSSDSFRIENTTISNSDTIEIFTLARGGFSAVLMQK
jgi:alpha-glucosidase